MRKTKISQQLRDEAGLSGCVVVLHKKYQKGETFFLILFNILLNYIT
jgi:hypothetical protein